MKVFPNTRNGVTYSRRAISALLLAVSATSLVSCATADYRAAEFKIGSATSRNVFVDASQFGNRKVKVRFRNSSGEPSIDMARMRGEVEAGLRSAGYEIADQGFGLVVDANLYFMNSVAEGRHSAQNEVGFLLGGVAGYEMTRGGGGLRPASGAIVGAIAGATLQDVLRSNSDYDSYVAICDVNIGVVRQQDSSRDSLVIGGNRFERESSEPDQTFESFAKRETLKVYVYAGDRRDRHDYVMRAIQERLARVVSNLI